MYTMHVLISDAYTIRRAKYLSINRHGIACWLTLNNTRFREEISNIHPPELSLKRTSECATELSYLDICIQIRNCKYTRVHNKQDSFRFEIVNFPFLCGNTPTQPAYGIYISQLVRIGRICGNLW